MTPSSSTLRQVGLALLFILVCQLAGILGAATTVTGASSWFEALDKPFFNPPSWVFGPVWTVLYTLMGVAAFLVWRQGWARPEVKAALATFGVQLLLNAAWTPVFFGAHQIGLALLIIVLLWGAIALTMRRFFPLSRWAGWLLVPYLLWVTFATALNAAIWALN